MVDSLQIKSPTGPTPVAVEYLSRLGTNDVAGVFITHWHEDHTRGAAAMLRQWPNSLRHIGLPAGFNERELAAFVADLLPHPRRFKLVSDLAEVMTALNEPALANTQRFVLGDRVTVPFGSGRQIAALSPSLDDIRHQALTLTTYLPGWKGPPPRRFDVNSGCAVLHVTCGPLGVMLSSDLDAGDTNLRGWKCIVQNYGTQLRSDIIKVGHHGSDTAHHAPALTAMSSTQAHGAVTPFPARGEHLPRTAMVRQYKRDLKALHITAPHRAPTRAGKVAMKHTPFSGYKSVSPSAMDAIGQIRYRAKSTGDVRVELFGTAAPT